MKKISVLFFLFFLISLIFLSIGSIHATDNITNDLSEKDFTCLNNENEKVITKNNQNIGKNESTNIILNSNNFNDYVTDGKFNENVSEGDTIDVQGKLDSPRFALNVNKPVNIISSTGDAYIDLDTLSLDSIGNYKNGIFQVTSGSTGTNITGITFHNTRVVISGTKNVHIDNITVLCESSTGFGVGSFSVRGSSENISVTNSYFKTIHNGGHSNVVAAGASNCLFENNTVEAYGTEGLVGNNFYLTTYGGGTNTNITIRNNTIQSFVPTGVMMATCWGLVLEGNGHVIENNYLSGPAVVKAQYAEEDYGVVTDLSGIIFRNNYVDGGPELTFPGEAYNNTITKSAELANIKAYNNTFGNVTINSNVLFENNTAKSVVITGENNTLNNNEVYSDDDYGVKVTGINNTLSDNKFASLNGRGENAISNSSEIVSINNSEDISRIYYVNDDNCLKYFDLFDEQSNLYELKDDFYRNDDFIILNTSKISGLYGNYPSINLTFQIDKNNENNTFFYLSIASNITLINTYEPNMTVYSAYEPSLGTHNSKTLINSTVLKATDINLNLIDSEVLTPQANILSDYASMASPTQYLITKKTGLFKDDVTSGSQLYLHMYDSGGVARQYATTVNIDRAINLTALPSFGRIDSIVNIIEGSEHSNFTNVTFDGNVNVKTSNINFINCTFNRELLFDEGVGSISLEGNNINNNISLTSVNDIILNNNLIISEELPISIVSSRKIQIENNTIITNNENTIIFDDESSSNIVKNNVLIAVLLVGDDTVLVGENIVEDNTPAYNTSIVINEDILFKNDINNVTVTVFNVYNNTPVDQGYVEIYMDGVLQGVKTLINGRITLNINTTKIPLGLVPLKVWYYNGLKYNNNVTKVNVDVVKSNVSVSVDEFTAKLNEKATTDITFLNQRGNPVQDTNISVTVGRTTYTLETVNGVASLDELVTSEWLDSGKMTVTFPDTDMYNRNTATVTLNTSKADVLLTPEVTVDGSTANIKLTYTDDLQQNVPDGKVSITTMDGTQLTTGRVTDGVYTAIVALPEGYSEEYLVANFTGSYYYNDLVRNIKLSGMLNSTITIETNSPVYGEELIITGKLVDSRNNAIKDTNITVNINGVKEVISTDADGNYTYSILPELGVNTITVSFDGNSDVYATSATKNVTIRDTDHDMNEVLNQLDELTAENARLQEQLDNLTQLSNDLKEQLANQTGELSEQNAALQQQIDTLTTIIAALTDIINSQNEQIAALTAPENTTIIFNDVVDARYKSDVVISGMLTSQKGLALSGQTVTLTIGDKTVDVITKNGEFEYTTVFKSVGEQTVTASYAGSDNYVASDASVTFDVAKQDVVVTVDPIADSAYGDNVTITGKFNDVDGKAISNSNVRVFVNGKKFLAKTDNTGTYTLSVKVNAVGENNVTVAYAGNDNYNSYEDTTTFKADKQDVVVTGTVINIPKVGENVTITGTFTDKNGKAIINSNVKITINGKKYYARTDSTGTYTFTTTVTSAGMNNVTVGYSGNDKYNSYEDVTTFYVGAQDVIVTVNHIEEVAVGDNVTITGTFTDKYGKAIINSNVKILFNGKKYYARTDSTGTYTFTTTVTTEGINNITVGYAGSAKYNAYETSTTFIAKAE